MQIISILLEELAKHETEHAKRPSFKVNTISKEHVSGHCMACNQHFGVKR